MTQGQCVSSNKNILTLRNLESPPQLLPWTFPSHQHLILHPQQYIRFYSLVLLVQLSNLPRPLSSLHAVPELTCLGSSLSRDIFARVSHFTFCSRDKLILNSRSQFSIVFPINSLCFPHITAPILRCFINPLSSPSSNLLTFTFLLSNCPLPLLHHVHQTRQVTTKVPWNIYFNTVRYTVLISRRVFQARYIFVAAFDCGSQCWQMCTWLSQTGGYYARGDVRFAWISGFWIACKNGFAAHNQQLIS